MPTALNSPILHRQVRVETPEHVAVGYELADLGSRFTALLLDALIVLSLLLLIWLGVPFVALVLLDLPGTVAAVGMALMVLTSFLVLWGYFAYFEGFRDGQTPGKRAMGLRVIQDGGYPLGFREAAIRNLLRIVDIFPPPSWLVGGIVMLLHPATKRVGDIVAGTVVVRERGELALPEEDGDLSVAGPPQLEDDEFSALSRYVSRRSEIPIDVRSRIAGQLLDRLAPRFPSDPRTGMYSADALLIGLYGDETRRRAAGGRHAGSALASALVRAQRARWTEYRDLTKRATRKGLAGLSESEVSGFATLYRETAADLARARTYAASPELVYGLERWVGAGHNLLYRPGSRSALRFFGWLAHGFPALVRARWRPIALAAALFFGPMIATGVAIHADPLIAGQILPAEMIARAEEGAARQAAGLGYAEIPELGMPIFASTIITNNIQVTILAFAGGVLAGLGTLFILLLNGVSIGGVFGLFAAHGLSGYLLAFVLPHGVIELTAICVAGGAGLWLGSALLVPGRSTRGRALVKRGREAVALLGGTAVLLLVAGLIEGFVSPAPFSFGVKAGVSLLSAFVLFTYLLGAGRTSPASESE